MIRILLTAIVALSISRSELQPGQSYSVATSYAGGAALSLPPGMAVEREETIGETTIWRVCIGEQAPRGIVTFRVGDAEVRARVDGIGRLWVPMVEK